MLSNKLNKHLETIEPAGSRMMRIRLKLKKRMDIIIVYGHTAVKDDKGKDEFYEQLQK